MKSALKSGDLTTPQEKADWAYEQLKRLSSKTVKDGMARYAIPSDNALGVPMKSIQQLGKDIGKDQNVAKLLWKNTCYEMRLLTAFVAEPDKLTRKLMDQWCKDFDNWAICDTLCMHLFDQTQHVWDCIDAWSKLKGEFQKRASFALLASLAIHDKASPDEPFLNRLSLIRVYAGDERNFVKKAVNWALRAVGNRSALLHKEALLLAQEVAEMESPSARWIGKDALRQLKTPAVLKRLERNNAATKNSKAKPKKVVGQR